MAPQSAQSRTAGQVLQHTAIVLAGMASIGLTVAAGTYVVNQIGGTGLPAVIRPGEADTPNPPASEALHPAAEAPHISSATARWDLAADSRPLPVIVTGTARHDPSDPADPAPPAPAYAATTVRPGGVGGRLNLSEDTYLGANLSRTQQHSLTVRLDTNLPAAFGTTESPRAEPDGAGVIEFRTDVDVHSGEFSVAMTDPVLGRHDMQVQRHTQPGAVDSEHPQFTDSGQA